MKLAVLFSLIALPAFAQAVVRSPSDAAPPDKPLCVDATRSSDYNARAISRHEVLARNAIGDRRGVRISTNCIHLDRAAIIGLRSFGHCIALGDSVAATIPGGPNQTCKVTGVGLTPEDYGATKFNPD